MILDDKKKQLEIEKLEHEINLIKKPYLYVSNYAKVITIGFQLLTGVIAFVFAYKNNWFDSQQKQLEIEKKTLQLDIKEFTATRQSLKDSIFLYQMLKDSIVHSLSIEQRYNATLKNENKNLQDAYINYVKAKDILDSVTNIEHSRPANVVEKRAYVAGIVRDDRYRPIKDAEITALFYKQGQEIGQETIYLKFEAKTDSNGTFYVGTDDVYFGFKCRKKLIIKKKGYINFEGFVPGSGLGGNYQRKYYLQKR